LLQPTLIQWIIFFSIGGLEAATFGPILLGMFWKKGNKWGALASISWGMVVYALGNTVLPGIAIWGTHPSLISVVTAVLVYVLVSLWTAPPSEKVVKLFWGKA
jgi:sodium/pantothenate symporter